MAAKGVRRVVSSWRGSKTVHSVRYVTFDMALLGAS